MKTKFSKYFEVKIQYQKMQEDGKEKKAKKLALGETIKFPSKKDDDFDEDEELD